MFRKKNLRNEAPRITDPTYISDCATMITHTVIWK